MISTKARTQIGPPGLPYIARSDVAYLQWQEGLQVWVEGHSILQEQKYEI